MELMKEIAIVIGRLRYDFIAALYRRVLLNAMECLILKEE